jgi:hypothetical protein
LFGKILIKSFLKNKKKNKKFKYNIIPALVGVMGLLNFFALSIKPIFPA